MSKSLWGVYDGEPFMENPNLGLLTTLNPRKRGRKKGRKMAAKRKRRMPAGLARYWATHRRKSNPRRKRVRNTHARRRRTYRRNWPVEGMVAGANPRRRRRMR